MPVISATQLEQFAPSTDATLRFGELMRGLVRFSGGKRCMEARFLSREVNNFPGWDGQVVLEATGVSPRHQSVWELGAQRNALQKIRGDLKKSLKAPLPPGWASAQTTYVAATLYCLKNPAALEQELLKTAGGYWGAIVVLDATALEHWLNLAAPMEQWVVEELALGNGRFGKSIKSYWRGWGEVTKPHMSKELVLAGRDISQLTQWLASDGGSPLSIRTDSAAETAALVCAAIETLPDDLKQATKSSALVLDDLVLSENYSQELVHGDGASPLTILLPPAAHHVNLFNAPHRVIRIVDRSETFSTAVEIKRGLRDPFEKALTSSMGLDAVSAGAAARACSSSPSLWRAWNCMTDANVHSAAPWWQETARLPVTVTATLIRSWDLGFEGDRDLLKNFVNPSTAEAFSDSLQEYIDRNDPLIERAGGVYSVLGPAVALVRLGRQITNTHLTRLTEAVQEVFSEIDDEIKTLWAEQESDKLFQPSSQKYSETVRDGLAETLLLIAVHGDNLARIPGLAALGGAQHYVERLILSTSGLAKDGRMLAALRGQLPFLAEAAPDAFLNALDELLQGDPAKVSPLFKSEGLFGRAYHTGLLWALETIAWDAKYLQGVTLALGALGRMDPGGNLSNRPARTLRTIYLAWNPGTSATIADRVMALETLAEAEPEGAWTLLLSLLPKNHDSASPTALPRWRDFGRSEMRPPTWSDVREAHLRYLAIAMNMLAGRRDLQLELFSAYPELPPDARETLLTRLAESAAESRSVADEIWAQLMKLIFHHKSFSTAGWALSEAELKPVVDFATSLTPVDNIVAFRHLFDNQWPDTDYPAMDTEGKEKDNQARRYAAIREIFKSQAIDGLRRLVQTVKYPYLAAQAIGVVVKDDAILVSLATEWLVANTNATRQAVRSLIPVVTERDDGRLLARLLESAKQSSWSAELVATIIIDLPNMEKTFDLAASLGNSVEEEYWKLHPWGLPREGKSLKELVIRKYIEAHRAIELLQTLISNYSDVDPRLGVDILAAVINEVNADADLGNRGMFDWYVKNFLKWLRGTDHLSDEELARFEYYFLPLLIGPSNDSEEPLFLHELLARSPDFFIEILCLLYRASSEPRSDTVDPQRARRATAAWHLLRSWRRTPGQDAQETIDAAQLNSWVDEVRARSKKLERAEIADEQIGHVLYHAGNDRHPTWLPVEVCQLIERVKSKDLESGFSIECNNSRGVTSRAPLDGGIQERALENTWIEREKKLGAKFPRTRATFRRIAESWKHSASWHDESAARLRIQWS